MKPGGVPRDPPADEAIDRLERFAQLLDAEFRVPGTRLRFGLDPLVGLLPGIGDGAMTIASLWIIYEAHRLGAPRSVLIRMLGNVAIDFLVGVVPLAGDLFDAAYHANRRNVALLRRNLRRRPQRADAGMRSWTGTLR